MLADKLRLTTHVVDNTMPIFHYLLSTKMYLVAFRRLEEEGNGSEELLLAHAYFQRKEENRITMRDFPESESVFETEIENGDVVTW